MSSPRPDRPASSLPRLGVVFALGCLVGLAYGLLLGRGTRDGDLALLETLADLAEGEFVDEVDRPQLFDEAARGMLESLDPYSSYYGPEAIARLDRDTYGEFEGIGVVFRPVPDAEAPIQILFPFPGSPAHEAGLRVGDHILAVDGELLDGSLPPDLRQRIARAAGGRLRFTVEGLDGVRREAQVVPRVIPDPTVRHEGRLDLADGIGYLSLSSFSHRTPEEFDRAVEAMQERGLRSLVIDLRGNPGGILEAAVALADRFLDQGTIVVTRTRDGVRRLGASAQAPLRDLALVLLIDGTSASASEVLAGALQDHAAAVLVGETTYGKGTVQTLTRIGAERGVAKITTADYFTPGWRAIDRRSPDTARAGIAPDVRVALPDEERMAIHAYLATYPPPPEVLPAIRAWEAAEGRSVLPPPPRDRPLEVALALLSGVRPGDGHDVAVD